MRALCLISVMCLSACHVFDASLVQSDEPDASIDATTPSRDASRDALAPPDMSMRDGTVIPLDMFTGCAEGQHLCDDTCVDDMPNETENGCAYGCGEPCAEPVGGYALCDVTGTCDFECTGNYVRDGETCICEPQSCADQGIQCGAATNGCGAAITCPTCPGALRCTSGVCACPLDTYEPNEDSAHTRYLATLNDYDDATMSWSASFSTSTDQDWYSVTVEDGTDFGDPNVFVTVMGPRTVDGYNWNVTLTYVCADGTNESVCTVGTSGTESGVATCSAAANASGSVNLRLDASCSGTSTDNGRLGIRVRSTAVAPNACPPYTFQVRVE